MPFQTTYSGGYEAVRTDYNGIAFRSKLEAKTAQALDNLGMKWEYEPKNYMLSNGLWYKPDFWLPNARQFVECKGEQTPEAMGKAHGLVEDTGYPVIVLGYDWVKIFKRWWDEEDGEIEMYNSSIYLARCCECGKRWFLALEDFFGCRNCGAYDGDGHFTGEEIDGANDLFELGQIAASAKYAKYCD